MTVCVLYTSIHETFILTNSFLIYLCVLGYLNAYTSICVRTYIFTTALYAWPVISYSGVVIVEWTKEELQTVDRKSFGSFYPESVPKVKCDKIIHSTKTR